MNTTLLGLIIVLLVLIILFQISRAGELIGVLRGNNITSQERNNKIHGLLFLIFMIVGLPLSFWATWYYKDWFLPPASSVHGAEIENMFFWTLVATVPVFVLTHIVLFVFSYIYSGSTTKKSYYFPGSNKLEMIWTMIPAFVMVLLVYQGMSSWYRIMGDAPADAYVIEATAKQFAWDFRYSGLDNKLGHKQIKYISAENAFGQDWKDANNKDDFQADTLHLPLNKAVLVKINALDVLHNFYLPHFKVKMDAVPGIPTQFWFIPTKTTEQMRQELNNPKFEYELACAELCGVSHFNMRRVVVVEEEAKFKKWLASQESLYKKQNVAAKESNTTPATASQQTEENSSATTSKKVSLK